MSNSISALFVAGRSISLQAKQTVFRTGDRVRLMYLVIDGQIDLVRHTKSGAPLILHQVSRGNVLAEASLYSETYHCDGVASAPSQLKAVSVSEFHDALHKSPNKVRAWAAQLAQELQKARMQSEIRSLNTVAERLDTWLGINDALPPKGQLQDLAHILGVTREALYRELARRRT